ncbi:FHA domain-containing protein [Leptolyngbya sp. GB1-A1]|uniref:FHA domain-containing protein n=1 Tax=Leptolyngbya sp. GB1-A1 TaxID=2933908 RepID=UPI0032972AF5
MVSSHQWMSYSSEFMDTYEDSDLQQKLGLYQVFCRLYEYRRELLDDILSLETSRALGSVKLPYVQGVVLGQPHLVTNLLGKTQALLQPEHQWRIGRSPQQSAIPIADRQLSRAHAAIEYVAQKGFYLTDLGSRNGTFVNGEPIRQPVLLNDGDRVRLGSISFIFFLCASAEVLTSDISSSQQPASIAHSAFSVTNSTPLVRAVQAESECSPSSNPLEETFTFRRSSG